MQNGQLYRQYLKDTSPNTSPRLIPQLVLPVNKRDKILKEAHADAQRRHLGEEKTFSRVRDRFYWPGYHKDVSITRMFANGARCVRIVQPQKLNHTLTVPESTWKSLCPGRSGLGTLQSNSSVRQAENSIDHGQESAVRLSLSIADGSQRHFDRLNLQPFDLSTSVKVDQSTVGPHRAMHLPALTCSCLRTTMMLQLDRHAVTLTAPLTDSCDTYHMQIVNC